MDQATKTLPPAIEPNKLKQAYLDYEHMQNERDHLTEQLDQALKMNSQLLLENEALRNQMAEQGVFYNQQIETFSQRNAKLNTLAQGLRTRLKTVQECIEAAVVEAELETMNVGQQRVINLSEADEEQLKGLGLGEARQGVDYSKLPTASLT